MARQLALAAGAVIAAIAAAPVGATSHGEKQHFLRAASESVGLFYVYSGACAACQIASPQIRAFADQSRFAVNVISLDGARPTQFAHALPDQGQLKAWGLAGKGTPLLLVYQSPTPVDPRTGRAQTLQVATPHGALQLKPCHQARGCMTYLGSGVMPAQEIAERVFDLIAQPIALTHGG